ncbi:MAG: proline dehydrogenase family protein, partial [Candidatus Nanohaloarchaea archaeon]
AAARQARDHYIDLVRLIDGGDADAHLSIRPTHLGLDISRAVALDNLTKVVAAADDRDVFVWLDMEDSGYTDSTIALYNALFDEHANVGVAIQAALKRSPGDIRDLVDGGAHVRLVTGAYSEPAAVAVQGREAVRDAFRDCLDILMDAEPWFAVGTHDEVLVTAVQERMADQGRDDVMFQFMMGVTPGLQRAVAADQDVGQYVPYGTAWLPYLRRRLRARRRRAWADLRDRLGR